MKKFLKIILILLLTIGALISLLFVVCYSSKVQKIIADKVINKLNENIDYKISLEEIKFNLPCKLYISAIALSQQKGELLSAKNLNIKFDIWDIIFNNKITFPRIDIDHLQLTKIPESSSSKNSDRKIFAKNISLESVNIKKIVIDPQITDLAEGLVLSLQSSADFSESGVLSFKLATEVSSQLRQLFNNVNIVSHGSFDSRALILSLKELKINAPAYALVGNSTSNFKNKTIEGQYSINSNDLNKLNNNIEGQINNNINISGSFNNIVINVSTNSAGIKYLDSEIPEIEITTKAELDTAKQLINLELHSEEIELLTNISLEKLGNRIEAKQIDIIQGKNSAKGSINYDIKDKTFEGLIKLLVKDTNMLKKYTDYEIEGVGEGIFEITRSGKVQRLKINANCNKLSFGDIKIDNIKTALDFSDLGQLKIDKADFSSKNVAYKDDSIIDKLELVFAAVRGKFGFDIKIDGRLIKNYNLRIIGTETSDVKNQLIINLNEISGAYRKTKIASTKPIIIKYDYNKFEYHIPDISIDRGKISGNGWWNEKEIFSRNSFTKIPLIIGKVNSSEFTKIVLDGVINLEGTRENPKLITEINMKDVKIISNELLDLDCKAHYINQHLKIIANIKSNNSTNSNLELDLPINLTLKPFKFGTIDNQNIKGNLRLNSKIELLTNIFLPPIHRFKGQIEGNINLGGTLDKPKMIGKASIAGGKYEHSTAGIKIKNISAQLEAKDNQIFLHEFKAQDDKNGTLLSSGNIIFSEEQPFNFVINANKFYFLNHPNIQSASSADIKISGDRNNASIIGTLEPSFINLQLLGQIEKEILELNVVKTIDNSTDSASSLKNINNPYKIYLNITVSAKNKVFIKGRGLEVELGGNIKCKGLINDPEIKGTLSTIKGKYQEFGKQLLIKEGDLIFGGPVPPSPYLNIVGSYVQDDIEILLILSGPLLKPKLSVESTPAMPQDEALSVLLFGKQATNISPFQALQLADSLQHLSGRGNSTSFLDKAKNIFKIDEIKWNNSSTNNSEDSIGVGKYLTDKIYVELEKGTQSGNSRTRIEVEIKNNLSVESSVGDLGSSSVGINWKYDY